MRRVRPTVSRILLAMATTTAIAGLLVALRAWWLAPAVAVAALSPFLEWHPAPGLPARALPPVVRVLTLLSFVLLWFSRPVPLIGASASPLAAVAGSALSALACACALAPRRFPPWRTLAPALVGVLALAGADPSPPGYGPSEVAAFRQAGHNGFADVYLLLSVLAVASLWAAALVSWGPPWSARRRSRPAATVTLALGITAVMVIGLPLAQPEVERVMVAALDTGPTTGLAGESVLGEFEELAVSRRRVLDLRATPPEAGLRLLPSEVLTRFDGTRWLRESASGHRPIVLVPSTEASASASLGGLGPWFRVPAASLAAAGGRRDELRFTPHRLDRWSLVLPRGAVAVTAELPYLEVEPEGLLRAPGLAPGVYGAVVAAIPAARDGGSRQAALELPPSLDLRVRALAARLAPPGTPPAERVARVVRHLRNGYRYTLKPGPFRRGTDPVGQFLFEKRQGYCEYFATAAAMLLRLSGVPARFVKGLRVSPRDDYGGGLFVVRESSAHAWVEAWLPGEGWIEVDATPPSLEGADPSGPGWAERGLERLRAALAEAWARVTGLGPLAAVRWLVAALLDWLGRPVPGLALCSILLASLLGPRALRRLAAWRRERREDQRARAAASVPLQLRRAVFELERSWRAAGRPRPPSRGLREHARALAVMAPPPPATSAATLRLIDLYYEARFGAEAPSAAEVERLRQVLSRSPLPAR